MDAILVTGGAGYIGSHTCKALSKAGFLPVTIDYLKQGHRDAVQWGPLIEGDIKNKQLLIEVIKQYNIQQVMHFASLINVGESVEKPLLYYDINVLGTLSLLQAMMECSVHQIIFSSSCATYGPPKVSPIVEDCEQAPLSPYGQTKLICEQILKSLAQQKNIKATVLRYFNAAGASFDGEIGEDHNPETHLIPLALKAALQNSTMYINGNDYSTPDGTCVRDYIHVDDLAQAHVLALQHLHQESNNYTHYNLGSEKGHSVKEVLSMVEHVTQKKLNIQIRPRREGDPSFLIADSSKIKKALKWHPKYSDLESIVTSAWLWEQKHTS